MRSIGWSPLTSPLTAIGMQALEEELAGLDTTDETLLSQLPPEIASKLQERNYQVKRCLCLKASSLLPVQSFLCILLPFECPLKHHRSAIAMKMKSIPRVCYSALNEHFAAPYMT